MWPCTCLEAEGTRIEPSLSSTFGPCLQTQLGEQHQLQHQLRDLQQQHDALTVHSAGTEQQLLAQQAQVCQRCSSQDSRLAALQGEHDLLNSHHRDLLIQQAQLSSANRQQGEASAAAVSALQHQLREAEVQLGDSQAACLEVKQRAAEADEQAQSSREELVQVQQGLRAVQGQHAEAARKLQQAYTMADEDQAASKHAQDGLQRDLAASRAIAAGWQAMADDRLRKLDLQQRDADAFQDGSQSREQVRPLKATRSLLESHFQHVSACIV